jgi:carotenoid 1,2-hydratase
LGGDAQRPPAFDCAVAPGGYVWWYLDALSDDGAHGLTLIAFIGSVFSPYYARSRRRAGPQGADPLDHCAINVVLYGRRGARWAMTERGRAQVRRDRSALQIGPSSMQWSGDMLQFEVDEVTVPWPARLRGQVTLHAGHRHERSVTLAPGHRWCPIAPTARADVALGGVRWSGSAYLDANAGDAPLGTAFGRWDWARARRANGDGVVLYDIDRIGAPPLVLGLRFGADGRVGPFEPPPRTALPATRWRIARGAHADRGTAPRVLRTLTDAPFYARSLLEARWDGERVVAIHESLSLSRFDDPWVQAMLPFRMPRRAR